MRNIKAPDFLAALIIFLCFGILYGSSSGLFQAQEGLLSQNVQVVSGILMLVVGFYFGASHERSKSNSGVINKTDKLNMKQVFWDLPLENYVTAIDGETISPIPASQLPEIDSHFSIGPDTEGTNVLMVETASTSVTLSLSGRGIAVSEPAEFIGSKPVRKPRP